MFSRLCFARLSRSGNWLVVSTVPNCFLLHLSSVNKPSWTLLNSHHSSYLERDLSPCVFIRGADCGWLTFTTSVGQMSPNHSLDRTVNIFKTAVSSIKIKCCDCTLKWPLCHCVTARNMLLSSRDTDLHYDAMTAVQSLFTGEYLC